MKKNFFVIAIVVAMGATAFFGKQVFSNPNE